MSGAQIRLFLTALLVLALAGMGSLFLYWIGVDALEGRSQFQFFADSETYHAVAAGRFSGFDGMNDFVTVAGNFVGPVLLLRAVGENYYLVLLVNCLLLYASISSLAKSLQLDVLKFTLLLLVNPLTISSILSVNKEILSLLFLSCFIRAYTAHSKSAFVCALIASILVRWQLTLFALVFAGIQSPLNPFRRHRWGVLFILLLGMSILYVELAGVFESINSTFLMSAGEYQGSGLFEALTAFQNKGGYILVFPFKAASLLFATGLRFDRLFAPADIYNDVWQLLHSTMTLVIFIALFYRRRFSLRNDLIYVSVIYLAVFAISPIHSPRYFYPLYVLWAAVLVAPSSGTQFLGRFRSRLQGVPRSAALAGPAVESPASEPAS